MSALILNAKAGKGGKRKMATREENEAWRKTDPDEDNVFRINLKVV